MDSKTSPTISINLEENKLIQEIRQSIAKDETEKAVNTLYKYANLSENEKLIGIATIIKARFSRFFQDSITRINSYEDNYREKNSLNYDLLNALSYLKKSNTPSSKSISQSASPTEESLLNIAKTAIIIIELEKIKEEFFNSTDWLIREDALRKLHKFSRHTTLPLAKEVFDFLWDISIMTKRELPNNIASIVQSLIINYFPNTDNNNQESIQGIANQCIQIGSNFTYYAAANLNDLRITAHGLYLLKWIHHLARKREIPDVIDKIIEEHNTLESDLKRESSNFNNAIKLIQIFKNDLKNPRAIYPDLPDNILALI